MKPRITFRDIAQRLGVSRTTVSRALRNDPLISLQRRRQVQRLATEMGYTPDPFLSSLIAYRFGKRPRVIQGCLAWINTWAEPERLRRYHEFDAIWRGAVAKALAYGYRLEEIRWPEGCSVERLQQILYARNVRGMFLPPQWPRQDWGRCDWSNISIVRIGSSMHGPESHLVSTDAFDGIQMAVKRIRDYGYKRIGFVFSMEYDGSLGSDLYGGFLAIQKILKLRPAVPPLDFFRDPKLREKNLTLLRKWCNRHKPDAILTSEPEMPAMILALGYNVPGGIAVAGTSVADIPITAGVNQNSEEIGRVAVETLVSLINTNQRGEAVMPCRILVKSSWRDGGSLPNNRRQHPSQI
jgi:DNA-binding LacI/PurR family transcriptional regulator